MPHQDLERLIAQAKVKVDNMSPEELAEMRAEQKLSWVQGEKAINESASFFKPIHKDDGLYRRVLDVSQARTRVMKQFAPFLVLSAILPAVSVMAGYFWLHNGLGFAPVSIVVSIGVVLAMVGTIPFFVVSHHAKRAFRTEKEDILNDATS